MCCCVVVEIAQSLFGLHLIIILIIFLIIADNLVPADYRELQREKTWSRIHLVPLLLAESDRDAYRRQQAALEREKEIMKDVPGWEVSKSLSFSDESRRLRR